jgi:predicted nucleic acid-binding protein
MRKLKLYVETSAWNFYFADDSPEKRDITRAFFKAIKLGKYAIFISQTVLNEIAKAVTPKKEQLIRLIKEYQPNDLSLTNEVIGLSKKYLSEGVIPRTKVEDALHVAVSTVFEMDALISWNNRHFANLRKMEQLNSVNLKEGYTKHLEIVTPMEVVHSGD